MKALNRITKITNALKPLARVLSWALLLVAMIWLMNQCDENRQLKELNEKLSNIDTIYSKKPFTPEKSYNNPEPPKSITIYPHEVHDTIYLESKRDTVYVSDGNRDSKLTYISSFLLSYPESEKLIQMRFSERKLELTTLNPNGLLSTKKYKINTRKNKYFYDVYNNLSSQKLGFFRNLHPTVGVTFIPAHLGVDANLGIRYTQNKLEYEVGFKAFYYSKLSDKPFLDAYIGVRFTL